MTRDKREIISLKEDKSSSVTLGNNNSRRIIGKGAINMDDGREKNSYCFAC